MLTKIKSLASLKRNAESNKSGNLNIEDATEVKGDVRGMWILHRAVTSEKKEADKVDVTVFTMRGSKAAGQVYPAKHLYEKNNNCVMEALLSPASLRGLQCLTTEALARHRVLKHPGVLTWLGTSVNSLGTTQMMTEPAVPLRVRMASREVSLDELCLGVASLAKVLMWLHHDCNLAYNNVSLDGIYVTHPQPGKPSRWVLGDFSFATPLHNGHDMLHHGMAYLNLAAPEDILPLPEPDARAGGDRPPPTVGLGSRDVYGLGCVVDHILSEMPGLDEVHDMRADLLHSLVEKVDPEVELDNTVGKGGPFQSTQGANRRNESEAPSRHDSHAPVEPGEDLSGRLDTKGRDMSAVLDILDSVIEWIDVGSVPELSVIAHAPHGYTSTTLAEELQLWALGAMHRSPCMRPGLDELIAGEFISLNPLVKATDFLSEGVHMASDAESKQGFRVVIAALDAVAYADAVEYVVPLLCSRAAFLHPLGDRLYDRVLTPNVAGGDVRATALPPSFEQFPKGTEVEAFGLQAAAELNGQRGTVVGFDHEDGRVMVSFQGGDSRRLKPTNLRRAEADDDDGTASQPSQVAEGSSGELQAVAEEDASWANPLVAPEARGVLNPMDYQSVIGGFIKPLLQQKRGDVHMKVALLRRARCLGNKWFDGGLVLSEVVDCLKDKSATPGTVNEELKAAACEALAPVLLAQRGALTQRQKNNALQVLHKLIAADDKRYDLVRASAVAGGVLAWGCGGSSGAAAALVLAAKQPDTLLAGALVALRHALACEAAPVPPAEISGVAVPLLTPLTLSARQEIRSLAHAALRAAYAALKRSGGCAPFPPTQPLPTPAAVMKS